MTKRRQPEVAVLPVHLEDRLDRSKNDFHYACRMLDLGLPASIAIAELALAESSRSSGQLLERNYTTQISTVEEPPKYQLPDGTWKTYKQMTEAERAAAHLPAP